MKIFLSGGAKNGKSTLAQRLSKGLAGDGPLYYAATMIPHDEEDEARIARHLREREGWGFETVECPLEPHRAMEGRPRGTVLFDSVTALLANEMFSARGIDPAAPERAKQSLLRLADWAEHIVFVSDFLYSDAGQYDEWTNAYRRGLADIDRALCAACDTAAEVCAGNVILHKGVLPE